MDAGTKTIEDMPSAYKGERKAVAKYAAVLYHCTQAL
jgi:hypothetical protein